MSDPSSATLAAKGSILSPLTIILVNRIGLVLLCYLGLALLPNSHTPSDALPGNLFLSGWVRWDASWYGRIAQHGYTNTVVDDSGQRDTVFMPLFPLAARYAGMPFNDVYIGGLLIANLAFVLAGLLLFRMVESQWNAEIAQRTLVLLCVFPFSYVFTAMYSESLFLLTALATICFGQKCWWLVASLCAAAAGVTRIAGFIAAITLMLMYFQNAGWRLRNLRWNALWLLLSISGLAAHMIYLAVRFHEPFAFVTSYRAKGWGDLSSWEALTRYLHRWQESGFDMLSSGNVPLMLTIHLTICLVAVILCIIAWRRLPMAYAAWISMLVLISFTAWAGFGRHFSTAFPAFIAAAMLLKDRRIYHGIVYLSTILLALMTLLFTGGVWVA